MKQKYFTLQMTTINKAIAWLFLLHISKMHSIQCGYLTNTHFSTLINYHIAIFLLILPNSVGMLFSLFISQCSLM